MLLQNEQTRGIVESVWKGLPNRFRSVSLDEFIIMPNHVHGVIILREAATVGAGLALPKFKGAASSAPTLGDVVRAFKSISAIQVNKILGGPGQPFWQRNYYEHIIRNEKELNLIREYTRYNYLEWEHDKENPARIEDKSYQKQWEWLEGDR